MNGTKFSKSERRDPPTIEAGTWLASKNVGKGCTPAVNALIVFVRAWIGSCVARVPRYRSSRLVSFMISRCTPSSSYSYGLRGLGCAERRGNDRQLRRRRASRSTLAEIRRFTHDRDDPARVLCRRIEGADRHPARAFGHLYPPRHGLSGDSAGTAVLSARPIPRMQMAYAHWGSNRDSPCCAGKSPGNAEQRGQRTLWRPFNREDCASPL